MIMPKHDNASSGSCGRLACFKQLSIMIPVLIQTYKTNTNTTTTTNNNNHNNTHTRNNNRCDAINGTVVLMVILLIMIIMVLMVLPGLL